MEESKWSDRKHLVEDWAAVITTVGVAYLVIPGSWLM